MYNVDKLLNTFLNKKVYHGILNSEWYGKDSKENFKKNLEIEFDKLKYYLTNPVTYKWNLDGFRSEFEFVPNRKLEVDIYLGCSHTMGTAHNWQNTWPYHVSKFTNNTIVNLGIGGGNVELSFINLFKYINYFKVKNIFHFQPIYSRYTYSYKNRITCILAQNVSLTTLDETNLPWKTEYIEGEMINDDYIVYHHFKHIIAIEGLCKQYNIPYFHLHEIPPSMNTKKTIVARDLIHYNTTQLEYISKNFIDKLKIYPMGYNEITGQLNSNELI